MTSEALRRLLEERKLSQRELARLCAVDERTVRRWVDSRRGFVPRSSAALICLALKIPLSDLRERGE